MYRGQIDDFGDWGAMAASRDLYAALLFLSGFASAHGLREKAVQVGRNRDGSVETMTVGQLLQIASDAYHQSIRDVVVVYRQLLENAYAADALAQVFEPDGPSDWSVKRDALDATLNQRPLAKRGLVNAVKRELAAREAER
jgi:hypothetical protein